MSASRMSHMFNIKRKRSQRGMTLMETLIAASMIAVVALAIYATMNSGIKIWQRVSGSGQIQDAHIFLQRIADDLRNSAAFSGIPFVGDKDSIQFATLINTYDKKQRANIPSVGAVGYYFDQQTKSVNRWQSNYTQLYQQINPSSRQYLSNVESLSFEYYYYSADSYDYQWSALWEEEETTPLSVRIVITLSEDDEDLVVKKNVEIPSGG